MSRKMSRSRGLSIEGSMVRGTHPRQALLLPANQASKLASYATISRSSPGALAAVATDHSSCSDLSMCREIAFYQTRPHRSPSGCGTVPLAFPRSTPRNCVVDDAGRRGWDRKTGLHRVTSPSWLRRISTILTSYGSISTPCPGFPGPPYVELLSGEGASR